MITTNKFDAEVRIDLMVPTAQIGPFIKGDDITDLLKGTFLNGYPPEEVRAIAIGTGNGKTTKVAFLWEDAGDAETWYIGLKTANGMNEERAADLFYQVAQHVMND